MWIKQIKKQNSAQGKIFYQYQLTQSSRMEGKVKHVAVLYLGAHPLLHNKENRRIVGQLLKDRILRQSSMIQAPAELAELAGQYYEKYKIKHPDHPSGQLAEVAERVTYEEIDVSSTRVTDTREIGCEWLVYQMAQRLNIAGALRQKGWRKREVDFALVSIISRAVACYSEHRTAQWLHINSGLMEFFSFPGGFIPTRHHLYAMASRLYEYKDFLEDYLYHKTLDIFSIEDKVVIYDLTNTYFEGVKAGSKLAQYGKSKEKRNDCKQVVLAAVVNSYGMLRYSRIYEGNMSDPLTLEQIIKELEEKNPRTPGHQQTLAIDAGISSEDNLKMLQQKGISYICVSKKKLKDYEAFVENDTVQIRDKRKGRLTLKVIRPEKYPDTWMYVKSEGKQRKEQSMNQQAMERFEQELNNVKSGIHKKGGTKQYGKVMERIGRIKERYPRIHPYYQLKVTHDEKNITTGIHWEVKQHQPADDPDNGVYFLRTNYERVDEHQMWDIYNTIREVEATFRTLKNDLQLRPIYHQKDQYTKAHLFLGILAYQLVAAIRYRLKKHKLNYEWKNIVRIMNTQKVMTVQQRAKTKDIGLRLCSKPIKEVEQIYQGLNIKHMPVLTRKFVVYH